MISRGPKTRHPTHMSDQCLSFPEVFPPGLHCLCFVMLIRSLFYDFYYYYFFSSLSRLMITNYLAIIRLRKTVNANPDSPKALLPWSLEKKERTF
ncbi:hypothetical protein QBC45DRAFT_424205 [Copromyces sp. CBS 386.78]|nr:hypothetical protein QBC45DRAFT_424205 [Copromyces sp. CBS 386.78]